MIDVVFCYIKTKLRERTETLLANLRMNENSLMEVVKKRFANFDLPKMAWLFSTEINYKNIKMVDTTTLYVCDPGFISIATPQSRLYLWKKSSKSAILRMLVMND